MSTTHTKGPWTLVDRVVHASNGKTVSGLVPSRLTPADLALIVEAPRMLAFIEAGYCDDDEAQAILIAVKGETT